MPAYSLPELPYDVAALEPHYPAEILALHHDKHHAAYVTGLNKTLDQLAEARESGEYGSLVGLEKTMAFNLSGHILHSLFWHNLSPDGGDKPQGELAAAIDDSFGSFDGFRDQLTQATVLVQGSGWGALSWEPLGRRLLIEQIYDHSSSVGVGSTPLLVIDAWEHAYYLKWRNVRADYVKSMWNIVNWADVAARFTARQSA